MSPASFLARRSIELLATGVASAVLLAPLPAQEIDRVPEGESPNRRAGLGELYERRDATADGWDSEAAAAAIGDELHRWEEALAAQPPELDLVTARCGACRVADLTPATQTAFEGEVVIRRSDRASRPTAEGADALAHELAELLAVLPTDGRRFAFKIYRVEPRDELVEIAAYLHSFGRDAHRSVQQNATWRMGFSLDPEPRLEHLAVEEYEEVERAGGSLLLADCTESVLGGNPSFAEQILPDLHFWWSSLDRLSGITFRGYQGLSVADVDGDGLDDLFVAQPGGLPDRLYLQRPDGTALDVSAEAGVDYLELTRGALLVDLDNDGDQDMAAVRAAHIVVLANDGTARFTPVAALELEGAAGVSAADYDLDGDLDLYGVAYRNPDEGLPPTPYHDAENGQRNRLYRNDGSLVFRDVTAEVGLDENNRRFSFAGVWEDYDNDGDPDLYVANDFGRNNLYTNQDGRFRDVAAEAGVEDISAGMGVTWADFDRDGWIDLHVSNMFSSAGGRVTYQRRFRPGEDESTRQAFQRHARGNSLFRNNGDGTFTDVSVEAGITMGRWAWGGLFADLDGNGFADIVVPNGFLTNEKTDDL